MRRRHRRVREGAGRLALAHRRIDPGAVEEPLGDRRPSRARSRRRRRAPSPARRPRARCARACRAAARCGPSRRACPCRATWPSWRSSGARSRVGGAHGRRPAPSTTSRSTRLARWRLSATSLKPRQRSEISLSLASVLVISVNRRTLSLNTLASASAAACRLPPSGCIRKLSVGSSAVGCLLALDLEAQRRHGLVEQPAPGAARGDRLLVEQPLELLLELVGLLLAQVVDPRLVAGERRHLQRALPASASSILLSSSSKKIRSVVMAVIFSWMSP